ncbi:hypothetical protein IG631_22540 [Alternaria alternata]|nr:hypothetical protein IG631_22540 [Alternaria alternata]
MAHRTLSAGGAVLRQGSICQSKSKHSRARRSSMRWSRRQQAREWRTSAHPEMPQCCMGARPSRRHPSA